MQIRAIGLAAILPQKKHNQLKINYLLFIHLNQLKLFIMGHFKLWTLTHDNTSPFVIIAVFYFLLLSGPFIYFMYLHGQQNYMSDEYTMSADYNNSAKEINVSVNDSLHKAAGQGQAVEKDNEALEEIAQYDWRNDKESGPFVLLTRLAIFSAVLAFGAIGSAVSLITRVRNKGQIGKITALELISIQTIGAIFACLLTLIFIADFIGGRLFPEPDLFYRIIYVHPAFAKLLIWSFIAGFSERFVPNILNNLVKESEQKEVKDKEDNPPND